MLTFVIIYLDAVNISGSLFEKRKRNYRAAAVGSAVGVLVRMLPSSTAILRSGGSPLHLLYS